MLNLQQVVSFQIKSFLLLGIGSFNLFLFLFFGQNITSFNLLSKFLFLVGKEVSLLVETYIAPDVTIRIRQELDSLSPNVILIN